MPQPYLQSNRMCRGTCQRPYRSLVTGMRSTCFLLSIAFSVREIGVGFDQACTQGGSDEPPILMVEFLFLVQVVSFHIIIAIDTMIVHQLSIFSWLLSITREHTVY